MARGRAGEMAVHLLSVRSHLGWAARPGCFWGSDAMRMLSLGQAATSRGARGVVASAGGAATTWPLGGHAATAARFPGFGLRGPGARPRKRLTRQPGGAPRILGGGPVGRPRTSARGRALGCACGASTRCSAPAGRGARSALGVGAVASWRPRRSDLLRGHRALVLTGGWLVGARPRARAKGDRVGLASSSRNPEVRTPPNPGRAPLRSGPRCYGQLCKAAPISSTLLETCSDPAADVITDSWLESGGFCRVEWRVAALLRYTVG